MLVTALVSQASGWLKAMAPENISSMVVTLLVSHSSGWLKAVAPENISIRIVTALVSHSKGSLKVTQSALVVVLKIESIFVILLVSQCVMLPYSQRALVESVHHAPAAACRSSRVEKTLGETLGQIEGAAGGVELGVADGTELGAAEGVELGAAEGVELGVDEGGAVALFFSLFPFGVLGALVF